MIDCQWVLAFDKIHVFLVQYREYKRAFDSFRHFTETVEGQFIFMLDQLNGDLAVCLDIGSGEISLTAKFPVIVENSVVSQRKDFAASPAGERMIILILVRVALRSHACVSHDKFRSSRNAVFHLMGRFRGLLNAQPVSPFLPAVSDTSKTVR